MASLCWKQEHCSKRYEKEKEGKRCVYMCFSSGCYIGFFIDSDVLFEKIFSFKSN